MNILTVCLAFVVCYAAASYLLRHVKV